MNAGPDVCGRLAASLPDIPRWIEARSMLLAGTAELFGIEENSPAFVCLNPYTHVGCVVGKPAAEAVRLVAKRLASDDELLAYEDNREYVLEAVPGWRSSPAVLHLLADSTRLPRLQPLGPGGMHGRPFWEPHPLTSPGDHPEHDVVVRFVSGDELADVKGASPRLIEDLQRAALVGKLAATFVDGKPVSFCDAATQTLWDIGVETLEPYRGRGYAALCVAYVVDQMGRLGKRPVWGAEESNAPSMRLAAKLRFRAVDRLVVVKPSV